MGRLGGIETLSQLEHASHYVPGDLRILSFIGGPEGIIKQHQTSAGKLIEQRAHPAQFLVELATVHA